MCMLRACTDRYITQQTFAWCCLPQLLLRYICPIWPIPQPLFGLPLFYNMLKTISVTIAAISKLVGDTIRRQWRAVDC